MPSYGDAMLNYVKTLPPTNILIVYFNEKTNGQTPYIATDVRILNTKFLINTSRLGTWVIVYTPSALKYLVTRTDTKIKGVISKCTDGYQSAGAVFDIASIGSHMTIGIKPNSASTPNRVELLNTHITEYSEHATNPREFVIDHSPHCFIALHQPINSSTRCLAKNGNPMPCKVHDAYAENQELLPIIGLVQDVFTGKIQVGSGPRGGTYIVKDGEAKRYISKPKQAGGVSQEHVNNIILMIYEKIVSKVLNICLEQYNLPVDAKLFYDTNNYFRAENPAIVLIYDNARMDRRTVFYFDIKQIEMAVLYFIEVEKDAEKDAKRRSKRSENSSNQMCCQQLEQAVAVHVQELIAV